MPIVDRPVDVIVAVDMKGVITPLKMRYEDEEGEMQVVKFVSTTELPVPLYEKSVYKKFSCDSDINDTKKTYELKYYIQTCKWQIYKI